MKGGYPDKREWQSFAKLREQKNQIISLPASSS
jgi:hypothetical protein